MSRLGTVRTRFRSPPFSDRPGSLAGSSGDGWSSAWRMYVAERPLPTFHEPVPLADTSPSQSARRARFFRAFFLLAAFDFFFGAGRGCLTFDAERLAS